jgi:hypothetical protein
MANFRFCFSVQKTGGSQTWPDTENGVGDQDIADPGRLVSSGLQVPGERGIFKQQQETFVNCPRCFSYKISFNCTSRDEKYSELLVLPFRR